MSAHEGTPWESPVEPGVGARPGRHEVGPAPQEGQLRLLSFGLMEVYLGAKEISREQWGKSLLPCALLFYLQLHGPATRGEIALDFWPEKKSWQVGNALHSALYQARRTIGRDTLLFQSGLYSLAPGVRCWCDAADFTRLLDQARRCSPADRQIVDLLEQAAALYRGPLLEEFSWEWCLERREELARRYLGALLFLGELYLDRQDPVWARCCYEKAVRADRLTEEAWRGLMMAYARCGERGQVARTFLQCCQYLQNELGVAPSEATSALYQALIRGEPPAWPRSAAVRFGTL